MSRKLFTQKPYDHDKAKHWIAIGRRVIAGDYNKSDRSTVESLSIGLRGYKDEPVCQQAFDLIQKL